MFQINCKKLSPPFMQALHTMEENTRSSQTPYAMKIVEKNTHTHTYIFNITAFTEPETRTS